MRGDALFGKRTFLVRHGRRATCRLSAAFLVAGVAVLPFVRDVSVALIAAYVVFLGVTLALLTALARSTNARRDSALIAAIAILGRGMLVTLYAHFAMVAAHWSLAAVTAMTVALGDHRRRHGIRRAPLRRAHQDVRAARVRAAAPTERRRVLTKLGRRRFSSVNECRRARSPRTQPSTAADSRSSCAPGIASSC